MKTGSYRLQDFKIQLRGGVGYIFDVFRKKWILLTPEEWVRQGLLRYLTEEKGYPAALIAVERLVRVGDRNRRFDAVVHLPNGTPWMLVECKAETEPVEDAALAQILAYQSSLKAQYLVLTNGKLTRCWHLQDGRAGELSDFPLFATE